MAYAGRVQVKAVRWVGVGTDRVSEMRAFATDVLGLRLVGQDGDEFVELAMADGAKLELFASHGVAEEPSVFAANPVIAGFLVDDIEQARDELARTPGVALLEELRVMPDGYAWQVFRAPDGHVYQLVAEPSTAG
jgi:catechol 2,3-dioxygenase-like lactoylglutathione lyase family enzyme